MATVSSSPRSTTTNLVFASAGPFYIGFRLFDTDAIDVYVDGERRTDFTITANFADGYDDAATITFATALVAPCELIVDGALTPRRADDYLSGDPNLTAKLNIEFGRIWSALSEIKRDAGRSIRGFLHLDPDAMISPSSIVNAASYAAQAAASAVAAAASQVAAAVSAAAASASASAAAASAALLGQWRGQWATGQAYALGDRVQQAGDCYICVSAHTSGTFSTDLAAPKWNLFASKGATGAGTGDVLASNNGSEFTNKATLRANIGLGSMATQNAGAVAITGGTVSGITDLGIADGGTGASTPAQALVNFGLTATAAEINALDGISTFVTSFLDDADAAAARATLGAEPVTIGATGVGQRLPISASAGAVLYLPSGGLWEYYWQGENVTTGVSIYQGAGVAAGGTAIAGPAAGVQLLGWAKKLQ